MNRSEIQESHNGSLRRSSGSKYRHYDDIDLIDDLKDQDNDSYIICAYNWLKSWIISEQYKSSERGEYLFLHFHRMVQNHLDKDDKIVDEKLLESLFSYNNMSSCSTTKLIRMAKSLSTILSLGVRDETFGIQDTNADDPIRYLTLSKRIICQEIIGARPSIDQVALLANELSVRHPRLNFEEYRYLPKSERERLLKSIDRDNKEVEDVLEDQ